MQTRFNQRLTTTDMRVLNEPLGELFDEQTTAFKVNLGYGFILMEKQGGRFKYYHSSCNCCGRYLEEPALITNRADFDSFLERIHESDVLQWAITQRFVTNVTSYRCRKCGLSLCKRPYHLHRHESVCVGGIRRIYPGGVYQPSPSIFQRLDYEGVVVIEDLRYYHYRATFDFECYFSDERLPSDSDKLQWSARHVPLSVSVASNVPGHEDAQCYVTNGDSDKLVEDMMEHVITLSDAPYNSLLPSYKDVLDKLKEQASMLDEVTATAHDDDENGKKTVNPYKTLEKQMQTWLHQLPVLGFNSCKYDLNTIVPLFIRNSDSEHASFFVIKCQNSFMCLSTDKLKFIDMVNYLAPGYSYDKYLKAYGCELEKGHFPYEYMDDLLKLDDHALPSREAFYNRLKN